MIGKFIFVIFVSLVFVLAPCCKQERSGWTGAVEEEGGVVVVKNPKVPLFGEGAVTAEEELSIGQEGGEDYMFSQIR